jgi:hypothetical protein
MRLAIVHALVVAAAAPLLSACCCPMNMPTGTTSTSPTTDPGAPPPIGMPPIGAPPTGAPPTGTPPTGTPPVEISPPGPGSGSGGPQVQVGGQNVWPPQGPGCERYVACCDAASGSSAIQLSCRLSVARQPVDCNASLTQVTNIMREMNVPVPAACSGP